MNDRPIDRTDAQAGMKWWNDATEQQRAYWLRKAGSDVPADAWAAFKANEVRRAWIVQRCIFAARNEYEDVPGYCERLMTRDEVMEALREVERLHPDEEFRGHNVLNQRPGTDRLRLVR